MQTNHWEPPSKATLHDSKPVKFGKTFQNHREQHFRNLYILRMYRRHLQSTIQILLPLQSPTSLLPLISNEAAVFCLLHTSGRSGLTEFTFSLQYRYHTIYKPTNSQRASQDRRTDKAQAQFIQFIRTPNY